MRANELLKARDPTERHPILPTLAWGVSLSLGACHSDLRNCDFIRAPVNETGLLAFWLIRVAVTMVKPHFRSSNDQRTFLARILIEDDTIVEVTSLGQVKARRAGDTAVIASKTDKLLHLVLPPKPVQT